MKQKEEMMAEIDNYLEIIRTSTNGENVRDAIINCMNEINKDSKFKVVSKSITHHVNQDNTHYYAPTGQVWKDVVLDIVLPDGSSETQTQTTTKDFTVNNSTENGDYPPEENSRWGTIHVDIDWSAYANEDLGEIVEITTDELDSNSIFHAETYGYTAVRAVKFSNVRSTGGGTYGPGGQLQYTVEYKDRNGKVVQAATAVPAGDNAALYYTGANPPDSGQTGTLRWTPQSSTRVYKNYTGSNALVADYIQNSGGGDSVTDSWEQIAANGGANVKVGDYKTLVLAEDKTITIPEKIFNLKSLYIDPESQEPTGDVYRTRVSSKQYVGQTYLMVCVCKGEPGSSTSWIAANPMTLPEGRILNPDGSERPGNLWGHDWGVDDGNYMQQTDWEDSALRQYINTSEFLDLFPTEVKRAIKPMTKAFYGIPSHTWKQGQSAPTVPSRKTVGNCRIWIPSVSEFRDQVGEYYNQAHAEGGRYPMTYFGMDTSQARYNGMIFTTNSSLGTRDLRRFSMYGGHHAGLKVLIEPGEDSFYHFDLENIPNASWSCVNDFQTYFHFGFCL